MKALAGSAIATALLFALAHVFAHLAVEHDAAGALLSPAGLTNPIAWLAAGGFFLARLASSGLFCVTLGLAASRLVEVLVDRGRARFVRDKLRE